MRVHPGKRLKLHMTHQACLTICPSSLVLAQLSTMVKTNVAKERVHTYREQSQFRPDRAKAVADNSHMKATDGELPGTLTSFPGLFQCTPWSHQGPDLASVAPVLFSTRSKFPLLGEHASRGMYPVLA